MRLSSLGIFTTLLALAMGFARPAAAETTECIEITSVPAIITVQGIYCLKGNLVTSASSGNAIDIRTNNVSIDMNGFKLGGLAAGSATNANGIFAQDRQNIVIRNGTIRGFYRAIFLDQNSGTSSGHLIEEVKLDGNRWAGVVVEGPYNVIRNNQILNTGPTDIDTSIQGGVVVNDANGTVVDANTITGLNETTLALGIHVSNSSLVVIKRNTVLDTDAGTKYGIRLNNVTNSTIIGNLVMNDATTGTTGIFVQGTSSGINCIDNTIAAYTTATSGCNFIADNNTP